MTMQQGAHGAERDVAHAVVPPEPGSVPATRAFLVALLRGWDVHPRAVDDAALLTTEIVTNAVVHGQGAVALEVRVLPSAEGGQAGLRVAVTDQGTAAIPVPDDPTGDREHGRGLWMVQALARDWGTSTTDAPAATTVWFELEVLA